MKKTVLPIFSVLLVFTLLFTISGNASAKTPVTVSLPDPFVTPVSGDMEFTTQVVPIVSLPGTTEFKQMLVPVGFPAGEAQYGGNGVLVTGMDYGSATACFYLATAAVNQGWGGKVGIWDGTKWQLLSTTITPLEESPNSMVCAPISGNGTYAFIKYIVNSSLLPVKSLPTCSSIGIGLDGWGFSSSKSYDPYFVEFHNLSVSFYPYLPYTLIQYYIINSNVPFTGDIHGSVISNEYGNANFGLAVSWRYDGPPVLSSMMFTIRIVTPVCYEDLTSDHWNSFLPSPPQ